MNDERRRIVIDDESRVASDDELSKRRELNRARGELQRRHEPRTLHGEPRLSIADEKTETNRIRSRERRQAETETHAAISTLRLEVDSLTKALRIIKPGEHRDQLRMIRRGLESIQRSLGP